MNPAYPVTIGEEATIDLLLQGRSIARYGDGEFRLMVGTDRAGQPHYPDLAKRLREILRDSGDCLVGIPNLRTKTPKAEFWRRFSGEWVTRHLTARPYCSSFITRPDSAPWINNPRYWAKCRQLWADKDVTVVRGGNKSLRAAIMPEARSVREIIGPRINAWASRDALMEAIGTPGHPVILCLGITATVMAADLCAKGVQAWDLGHMGMFLRRVGPDGIWHQKDAAP